MRRALILCSNNVTEAARHLRISRLTLYRVLERSAPWPPESPDLPARVWAPQTPLATSAQGGVSLHGLP